MEKRLCRSTTWNAGSTNAQRPDIAQDDKTDRDGIAETFAPSEDEDDADIADLLVVNALIAAGVDRTCAELYTKQYEPSRAVHHLSKSMDEGTSWHKRMDPGDL